MMDLKICLCDGEHYAKHSIQGRVTNRVLRIPERRPIEVKAEFLPEISDLSGGRFNVLFRDRHEEPSNERKYYTKVGWLQKEKLRWMFGENWLQRSDNAWKVANLFIGFLSGYLLHYFTHK